jgi:hypothetical protein
LEAIDTARSFFSSSDSPYAGAVTATAIILEHSFSHERHYADRSTRRNRERRNTQLTQRKNVERIALTREGFGDESVVRGIKHG